MVTYIEYGNIFNVCGVENYAHGCNCAGAMGKGIALQFKDKFPEMFKEYKKLCVEGNFSLGDVFTYNYGSGYVFNLATQKSWRSKACIDAIEKALKTMLFLASKKSINKIALPAIGSGLGGIDWSEIKTIIDKLAVEYSDIEIFVVEHYKST